MTRHGPAEPALLDWAESLVRDGRAPGDRDGVRVLAREDDAATCALLEDRGYVVHEEELRLFRPLAGSIPRPDRPPGFAIRPLADAAELDDWPRLRYRARWYSRTSPA